MFKRGRRIGRGERGKARRERVVARKICMCYYSDRQVYFIPRERTGKRTGEVTIIICPTHANFINPREHSATVLKRTERPGRNIFFFHL